MIQLKYTEKHTKRVRHRLMTHPPINFQILLRHIVGLVLTMREKTREK